MELIASTMPSCPRMPPFVPVGELIGNLSEIDGREVHAPNVGDQTAHICQGRHLYGVLGAIEE